METVRYPSRSRSRALSEETPQLPAETPQLTRGRSLGPVLEDETPQMPERLRRKFAKQMQRAQRQGQLRLQLGKFAEQQRARLAAQEAEQRGRSVVLPLQRSSVAEAIEALERSGNRPVDELSPKVRKKPVPIGTFMSRQKTTGGEVRRYKPVGLA